LSVAPPFEVERGVISLELAAVEEKMAYAGLALGGGYQVQGEVDHLAAAKGAAQIKIFHQEIHIGGPSGCRPLLEFIERGGRSGAWRVLLQIIDLVHKVFLHKKNKNGANLVVRAGETNSNKKTRTV
jgi:hypothetical protein